MCAEKTELKRYVLPPPFVEFRSRVEDLLREAIPDANVQIRRFIQPRSSSDGLFWTILATKDGDTVFEYGERSLVWRHPQIEARRIEEVYAYTLVYEGNFKVGNNPSYTALLKLVNSKSDIIVRYYSEPFMNLHRYERNNPGIQGESE
jgi:hypothetical protein